ncbi:MAG: ClbS/DfsB family four-helix bundle protein [Chloroflexi bacterium]|uniref:hypothetical protein n=1 Tax=Candidatus Flexifilum breve TaxID=3140694 RepID=UPI0031365F6A|nr:ClbS/DfsB family four-helix bundle protein [Chloroflexota bacterium]
MSQDKASLLQSLDAERDNLWAVLADVDPAVDIYPGWNKRDFFAHMAGWDALMFTIFRDTVAGIPVTPYPYINVDVTNAQFVAERQSATVDGARLECEINRFALKIFLESIPAEAYGQLVRFPWASETVTQFVEGAIIHERDHARDIVELKQAGKL